MNKFEKVTFNQYFNDMNDTFYKNNFIDLSSDEGHGVETEYNDIKLPKRATKYSAGYDFYSPFAFVLKAGQTIKIPTGIKCKIDNDKFLAIVPRSSLGFNYRLQLDNTFAVVDSDYYGNSKNEGHIFIKITNDSKEGKVLKIDKGGAFAQGIFLSYALAEEEENNAERVGGIGSTNM